MTSPPSPNQLRNHLEDLLRRDLCGPMNGPDEVVSSVDPRQRYLLGALAPRDEPDDPEPEDDSGDFGWGETVEEGTAPPPVAKTKPMLLPNCMGLTCAVDKAVSRIHLQADWGFYDTIRPSLVAAPVPMRDDQRPATIWQRTPKQGFAQIPLQPGEALLPLHDEDGQTHPNTRIRIIVRERADQWILTVFLVNEHLRRQKNLARLWMFQAGFALRGDGDAAVFCERPTVNPRHHLDPASRDELNELDMLHRHQATFAVGHAVSVDVTVAADDPRRATRVATAAVPRYELPLVQARNLATVVLDMAALAQMDGPALHAALSPLVLEYDGWITQRQTQMNTDPSLASRLESAQLTLAACRKTRDQIQAGIDLLRDDPTAAACFQFANQAMALQRTRSLYVVARRRGERVTPAHFEGAQHHSWRPFQLAFILINLPGLTRLDHPDRRAEGPTTPAHLLWFPTGGGKTEAYLGLSAYTLAVRRRQGVVSGYDGNHGVAVFMRYTLRLLTLQQYQRATAMICACEVIRRQSPEVWGQEPFRIGLWVGYQITPNHTAKAKEFVDRKTDTKSFHPGGPVASPLQFGHCPWCATEIKVDKDLVSDPNLAKRTQIFCDDGKGRCPFTKYQGEGLPVVSVDEEIYRLLPSMIIATVDKLAQMPWNGQIQMLFGRVTGRCTRHGFVSKETDDAASHPAKSSWPAAKTLPAGPLRPPDLIIQDELHLISGPLGAMVGLYETAVDELCTWQAEGRRIKPKLVLSTATIRRAHHQVRKLYDREVEIFPPNGLDAGDNFFAERQPLSDASPGRLYLGVCATGHRVRKILVRVYAALLSAGQVLFNEHGGAADPWMTLVGYFNSRKELGSMRRLVEDAVEAQIRTMNQRGMAQRFLEPGFSVEELTSRKSAIEIPEILQNLSLPFTPPDQRPSAKKGKRTRPYDVLLATNMISVGVDVPRLGLMVVNRQPKTTSEYIQATSRVGRRAPGLVVTVFNWSQPRDLSHYEQFADYHAAFDRFVEPLSITPFAARALDRGLTGVLVSLIRQWDDSLNANEEAAELTEDHPNLERARAVLLNRLKQVEQPMDTDFLERMIQARLRIWLRANAAGGGAATTGYRDGKGDVKGLLQRPESGKWTDMTCLSSLRNVEPPVYLVSHGHLNPRHDDKPFEAFVPGKETS